MEDNASLPEIIEKLSYSMERYETNIIASSTFSGLTMTQIHYLDAINHLKNPTPSELARHLKVSKPSVTFLVEKLENKGYAKRVRTDEDRRAFNICLTEKGKKITDLHDGFHRGYAEKIESILEDSEVQQLIGLLAKVLESSETS